MKRRNIAPNEDAEGSGVSTNKLDYSPDLSNIDGISMLPARFGQKQRNHDFLYSEFHESGFEQAVRMGDWKAVRRAPDAAIELYDLKTDVSEQRNIATKHSDVVKKIEDYLKSAHPESRLWPIKSS